MSPEFTNLSPFLSHCVTNSHSGIIYSTDDASHDFSFASVSFIVSDMFNENLSNIYEWFILDEEHDICSEILLVVLVIFSYVLYCIRFPYTELYDQKKVLHRIVFEPNSRSRIWIQYLYDKTGIFAEIGDEV